ncbi:MAG: DegT/DnrJ/EryC1/StrS aminotransferase family protein [Azospirillum sp.]|nr:DegT/DnrJ/EryC1/StrS aminotransferase family protein [Azospirillum sp.]
MTASAPIAFIDLQAQRARMGAALEESILRVVRSGRYIMGPEIGELERKLSEFCGAPYALSCANGTDALALLLMLKDLKPGQAVLVPSFTFAATGEVVVWFGATPIFVDCDEATFCVDPASAEAGVARAKALGLEPVGMIAVDLFGHPADYDALEPIARKHGLWLMSDCAQGFGATYKGRRVGALGDFAATSFFPAKPLGCYGDGGAVFVRDKESVAVLESLRVHGQGEDKYDNVRVGMNGRMDTVQAAVLLHKLAIFEDEIEARQRVAARYAEGLGDVCGVPRVAEGCVSTWAQYTIRVPADRRAAIVEDLKKAGVPTAIYYVRPMHRQTAYAAYPVAGNGLPVSERLSREALSLPMHAYLTEVDQDRVVRALRAALAG